ncbi:MAG: MBL fold metallo-hydrolase [Acidobacteriota bacterium]|jgi:glyoxylase-like metal-dependent hydrolase (beta-lactamase superfamily II)
MHPASTEQDEELVRLRQPLGDLELVICSDGTYLLDGGAMFGVVPKPMWEKRTPADEQNRILLGLNTVVVRTGAAVVLIETGIGNKQPAKLREIHQNQERLPASLAAAGVRVEEVTHVVNTHLHFDHCGWNTTLGADGVSRPTFPNARYFAPAGELEQGRLQRERDRVSYLWPNYDPLIESGQLTLIDPGGRGGFTPDDARLKPGDGKGLPPVGIQTELRIAPGVTVENLPGHTPGLLGVHIEARAHGGAVRHACYVSDLVPTHHHLDATWVMGYDLDPLTCIQERKRFWARAIPEQWLVLFTHDHQVPAAFVTWNDKGKPVVMEAGAGR